MSTQEAQQTSQVTQGLSKKSWIIIVIEAIIFIMLLGTVTKCSNDKIERLEHNIDAYRDTIEYVELQNGELLTSKQSLILSEKELNEELDISKREIKDLEKKLGDNIAYIARLEAQVNLKDTVFMKSDTVFIKDSITIKKFNWHDDWLNMTATVAGQTLGDSKMSIDNFNMNVALDIGLTDDYRFWAKTSNPYVSITDINAAAVHGSEVSKKDKRFHHGVTLGFGFHYGLWGRSFDFGPGLMYGFTYSF